MDMHKKIRIIKYLALLLFLLGLNSGCAVKDSKLDNYIFYPPSPLPPRIQFLTSYSSSNDLLMADSSLSKFLLGEETGNTTDITKPYGVDIHGILPQERAPRGLFLFATVIKSG